MNMHVITFCIGLLGLLALALGLAVSLQRGSTGTTSATHRTRPTASTSSCERTGTRRSTARFSPYSYCFSPAARRVRSSPGPASRRPSHATCTRPA